MIVIPKANWHMALAAAIEHAPDGEIIHVRTKSQAELGKRAHARMCPNKTLTFEFEVDDLTDDSGEIS